MPDRLPFSLKAVLIAQTISHYRILAKLGEGGMGANSRARSRPASFRPCSAFEGGLLSKVVSIARTFSHTIKKTLLTNEELEMVEREFERPAGYRPCRRGLPKMKHPIAFRRSRRMVWGILTLLTALSQPTIWAQEAQQVAANQMSAQEIKWKATKPQLVYVSESPDRYSALPCIIRLQDGTLLASMEHKAGETATTVLFIESADGGSTWSDRFAAKVPIANATGVMGLMNDGRVFMACTQWHGKDDNVKEYIGKLPDGRPTEAYENYRIRTSMWMVYSSDKGRTWTDPQKVDYRPLLGAWVWSGGRPLQLPDGTIIIPVAGYLSMEDMSGILLSNGVVRSANAGKAWTLSVVGRTDKNEGLIFSEPAMAPLQDSRLVILMRTESRVKDKSLRRKHHGLYRAVSHDGGKTWSSPTRVLAGTHCSIVQLGDGKLLCGMHPPIRAAVSHDAGKTWSGLEPWFAGRESAKGWYSNLEYVDENTAVAMIKDSPKHEQIWVCRVERVQ